jgi:excisionase family DNA binding protein
VLPASTIGIARRVVRGLREQGAASEAGAVEALIAHAMKDQVPPLDYLTAPVAGQLLGVSGQTIKNWVREGRIQGFRLGNRIVIPRALVMEYIERAGASLDDAELDGEAAAALVREERGRR